MIISMLLDNDVSFCAVHYEIMPVKYTALFQGCRNDNFQMKIVICFLIFAKVIDREYALELPHYENTPMYTHANPCFTI